MKIYIDHEHDDKDNDDDESEERFRDLQISDFDTS